MSVDHLPELALVPGGDFLMGSVDAEEDERPVHRVQVDDFYLGVQPVTNGEYAEFVRATGHRAPAIYELPIVVTVGGTDRERVFRQTGAPYVWTDFDPPRSRADHPVTLVRYDDALAYCEWLSNITKRAFRLPTEAEWEKAARGGAESKRYPWGDRLDRNTANFLDDPALRATHGTSPCRHYPANAYGLYDMAGNVWEWVQDWYDAAFYATSPDEKSDRSVARLDASRARWRLAGRRRPHALLQPSPQGPARHLFVRHRVPCRGDRLTSKGKDHDYCRRVRRRDCVAARHLRRRAEPTRIGNSERVGRDHYRRRVDSTRPRSGVGADRR